MDKTYINIEKYGNTSAASVPMALTEATAAGRINPGDQVLMVAFGAGYTGRRRRRRVDRGPGPRLPGTRLTDTPRPAAAGPRGGQPSDDVRPHRQDGARHRRKRRGLGRAIALAFARQGADVAANYRGNADAAEEAVTEITASGRRAAIQGDTSDGREA